jgi:ArsR family transcriptional regulator
MSPAPERAPGRPAELARVFKALGDPTRLAIFELIRDGVDQHEGHTSRELARTVSGIASGFDVSLSTVSHHLKELRAAGLIQCERRGQSIYCSIDPAVLTDVERFLAKR